MKVTPSGDVKRNMPPVSDRDVYHLHEVEAGRPAALKLPQRFRHTWSSAIICLMCTSIIVVTVILALFLSRKPAPPVPNDVSMYIVPKPQNLVDRSETIVVHRKNPTALQSQTEQLQKLLEDYRKERQICDNGCPFPVHLVTDKCSIENSFGYREGNPCVALVFRSMPGWIPERLADGDMPEEAKDEPSLLYVSCKSEHRDVEIRFSPFHGYPMRLFPLGDSRRPPMMLIYFVNPPLRTDIWVTCRVWAKNVEAEGKVTFKLLVV